MDVYETPEELAETITLLEKQVSDLLSEVEHVEDERDEALSNLVQATDDLYDVRLDVRAVVSDLEALSEVPLKDLEAAIEELAKGLREVI